MFMSRSRLASLAIVAAGLAVGALATCTSGGLTVLRADMLKQVKAMRKTTEPPVPAVGKLGQDLFLAIDHRDLAAVKALLKQGADPNARNGLEFTPLFIAAGSFQPQVMDALLAAGAKVNAASPYGTALTFAASSGNVPAMRLLLSKSANVNPRRADGITVLMLVALVGSADAVTELLQRKADVNATDNDGATPLIYAAREGHMQVGRMLLNAGAGVDTADSHGDTPLIYAAENGHADFVRLLLDHGAKPDVRNASGQTALVLTAKYADSPEVTQALLATGDAADKSVAATIAESRGHYECAKVLGGAGVPEAGTADLLPIRKQAVQKSLKLIQTAMLQFNKRTGCVSCHQEGLGRIATGAARDFGFHLDPTVERLQEERINGMLTGMKPLHLTALKVPAVMKQVPLIEINEVSSTDTWLLAGMAAHNQPANAASGAMAMVLARQQLPDGSWRFSLPREPMQSSNFTFTALAVRALRVYGPRANSAEIAGRIHTAKSWLLANVPQNSEDRASRLLGLRWAEADAETIRKAGDSIRADQRPDGGWAQLPTMVSDAYATGQALYALHVAGRLAVTDTVYDNGVKFLLRTQDDDGSWFVSKRATPANNYFDAGFPHGESQYSSFNGTCWAMMALLQTVGSPQQQASAPTP